MVMDFEIANEAVSRMEVNFLKFSGRSSREEFWWVFSSVLVFTLVGSVLYWVVGDNTL